MGACGSGIPEKTDEIFKDGRPAVFFCSCNSGKDCIKY